MITNNEITNLSREYAEEATKADAGDPNLSTSDLNGIKRDVAEYAEEVINFLLRRFYFVEKETVHKEYDLAEKLWIKSACATTEEFNMGRMNAIESLFPNIKEKMEG